MFWADLAFYHQARVTQNWLHPNYILFLPKHDNSSNLPLTRPIEDFWGHLSHKDEEGSRNICSNDSEPKGDVRNRKLRVVEMQGSLYLITKPLIITICRLK